MTQTIFVSSTFMDLEVHRRHVRDAIARLELTFKAMEFFGALPDTPKAECLRLVRASNIFVGIIGMRYGFIDPDDGKSMTQLEYEEAQAIRLPTLIYLIDEDHHPMLPKFVDTGAGAEKLMAFKGQLRKAHVVNAFSSPEDLAAKVTQDVVRLVGSIEKAPGAQILPQLAATATRMHRLTPPRFAFLKGKVSGACTQDVPDSVLHESLGFLLGGDNMAAAFTLSRGAPMSLDDAIDSLMRIEETLMELVKDARSTREREKP
ncbi:DUF4062 domain-containing protein [Paracidovorax oryzae]|uniref:DUF4062 domain-containing protein n=1 Tax=Paracidovorax oryzae TaxID=862720 RepID=UPI00047ACA15|nr:DUF4062 domain-containing protein [Paracidovorax oryzae]